MYLCMKSFDIIQEKRKNTEQNAGKLSCCETPAMSVYCRSHVLMNRDLKGINRSLTKLMNCDLTWGQTSVSLTVPHYRNLVNWRERKRQMKCWNSKHKHRSQSVSDHVCGRCDPPNSDHRLIIPDWYWQRAAVYSSRAPQEKRVHLH